MVNSSPINFLKPQKNRGLIRLRLIRPLRFTGGNRFIKEGARHPRFLCLLRWRVFEALCTQNISIDTFAMDMSYGSSMLPSWLAAREYKFKKKNRVESLLENSIRTRLVYI